MPVKTSKYTIGILASVCLVGAASAQDKAIDDRFQPRVYGSLAVTPAQISHDAARVSGTTASRNVVVQPVTPSQGVRAIPTSSPRGSYSYADVEAEAERVIAFQSASSPSISESYTLEGPEYNVVPQERRYQVELFEPVAPTYASTTQITQSQASYSAEQSTSHYVDEGDTLYSIAKRYNTDVETLKARNNIAGSNISIGDTLAIPDSYQPANAVNTVSAVAVEPVAQSNLIRTIQPVPTRGVYAVLPKDTLYSISKRACVTVEGIQAQNGLGDSTEIDPGQRLSMPAGHCLN